MISVLSTPAFLRDSVTLKIPGIVHHKFEVIVAINAHRNVVVVLDPFCLADASVLDVFLIVAVVLLEGVQELEQDLVLGPLSRLNIRVHLAVVLLADVVDVEDARLVAIHDGERFHGHALTELVHLSAHAAEELFVVDGA